MSVYPNQTNATLTDSYFAAAGSGGGGGTPSNWSSYPALSTITYSGAGGIANLTTINALTRISTPSLFISSINNASYPPAAGPTIVTGKLTIAQGFGSTINVPGCLSTSVPIITPCITNGGDPNVLLRATAGTNSVDVAFASQVPGGTIINYAVFI
jgi:hypothetical protein